MLPSGILALALDGRKRDVQAIAKHAIVK